MGSAFHFALPAWIRNTGRPSVIPIYHTLAWDCVSRDPSLTAQGNRQVYGQDYWDTYAPCVSFTLARVFLSIAASRNYHHIHLVVIKTAYLNGVLNEEFYGIVPEGMEEIAEGRKFMRILKSLYGLKQAGRIWAIRLQTTLKESTPICPINHGRLHFH